MPTGTEEVDVLGPLQKAIYARLKDAIQYTDRSTDPPTTRTVPVYDKPPEDAEAPFILTGEISAQAPNNTKDRIGKNCAYSVHVASEYRGNLEASEISGAVIRAITKAKLDLSDSGLSVAVQRHQQTQARELGDAFTIEWTIQFYFTIFQVNALTGAA